LHKILVFILKIFYSNLYHSFAWSYDFVAWIVSSGEWFDWVKQTLAFVSKGDKVLEIGFGTGVLFKEVTNLGNQAFGIDESRQMIQITRRRLKAFDRNLKITQGNCLALPYKNEAFDLVLSTFPTEFVFNLEFQAQIRRVLNKNGKLVALLGVTFNRKSFVDSFYRFLYALTGQNFNVEFIGENWRKVNGEENLRFTVKDIPFKGRILHFLLIEKF
jgi:ubiquinone/menaquinone biosynthesis C-methylase UbiE